MGNPGVGFLSNVGGRKFILTILYMVLFALNYALQWNVPWEGLVALAAVVGIYDMANAIKGYGAF